MKIFISGPMSGKPLCNAHAFYNAERHLKEFGFSVWNPAWQQYPDDTEFTRDDMHFIDNAALHMCDAIYMLEGWQKSDGARAEYELAKKLEKIIIHETAKFDDVNQAINDVEADLDNFKDKTDGKPNDIYDMLHRHEDEIEDIKKSIGTDNLQEQLDKDFDDVYTEFQNIKDNVNDIEFGYIDWSSKMSSAIDEMEKVKETVKGLNSLVVTLGERNGVLLDKIDDYKEAYRDLNNHYNVVINNTLTDFNIRLKAIEKRLSIKPFYEPTEDEKDD